MFYLRKNSHWLAIIVGTLAWSVTMFKSGLIYSYGMGFWGANGHDGIWHISLAESLSRFTLEMPIYAGAYIKNYHLGFDILLAFLHFVTHLPTAVLYFQILPPILALLIGWLTYVYTKSSWSIFFVYFGGSLGWMLSKGESVFWSQQAISTLINPPYALSLIIILLGLISLKNKRYLLASILFGILPDIKIYGGLLAFFGLLVASCKDKQMFKVLLGSLFIFGLLSLKSDLSSATNLLVWQPGWFLRTMFAPDRLDWPHMFSALSTYTAAQPTVKSIVVFTLAFGIFWIGNMGVRLLFLYKLNSKRLWSDYFSLAIICAGSLVPMLFIQSGTSWNTIQFFYYSLFFSSLLVGQSLKDLLFIPKLARPLQNIIFIAIIVLTIPTSIDTLTQVYLPSRPPAMLSNHELTALTFLKKMPSGTVLTMPFDNDAARAAIAHPPRPLYLYESTAYVSAFSGHQVFLEDQVNLDITGYDWEARQKQVHDIQSSLDITVVKKFMSDNAIRYIYLPVSQEQYLSFNLSEIGTKSYENPQVQIWQIRTD